MKRVFTLILVMGWVLTTYSQKIIQLEEARLNFNPKAEVVFEDYANGIVRVKESHSTQFEADALTFMKNNFDISKFQEAQGKTSGDIIVTARSSKGFISATYNKDGEIVSNYQKFKDIAMPYEIRNEVYAQYKGWTVTSNKYVASGSGEQIDKANFLVKLEKGKEKTKLRLAPKSSVSGVASIN